MKSRATPTLDKKQIEIITDDLNKLISEMVNKNFLVVILTLYRDYGWGKKRMNDFIKAYNENMDDAKQWDYDGVLEYEIGKLYKELNVPEGTWNTKVITAKEVRMNHRMRERKSHEVAYKDAKKMGEYKQAFENFMKGDKINAKLVSDKK